MSERAATTDKSPQASAAPAIGGLLQRKCNCGNGTIAGGQCEGCRKKKLQRKLSVGSTDDPLEFEADRVAEQVMRAPRHSMVDGAPPSIQRASVQPHAAMETAPESVDEALASSGAPLDPMVRADMERGFGRDFSNVRVHLGPAAQRSARDVQARAYTVGHDIVFGAGQFVPGSREGRHLIAHELTHSLQQQSSPQLRRKLSVDPNLPKDAPTTDPSSRLTPATRFSMMNTLIQGLCPKFKVDSAGAVTPAGLATPDRTTLAAGSKATGCCCLSILTEAPTQWTIEVASLIGAQTEFATHRVFLNPTDAPVELGSFTDKNTLAFQGTVPAAGHELCGHAALQEVNAHPPGDDRMTTDVHDPTVRIENRISAEQGVPATELRGLARSGSHRGESVDRITIGKYPLNGAEIPSAEQDKLDFAAKYIFLPGLNNEYVGVLGHSDSVGSAQAKKTVSDERAKKVQTALIGKGVPPTIKKFGLPETARFTRVAGLSDSQPPAPPLNADTANWRRVEILMSGFPAGAQVPPSATPTGVSAHTQSPDVPKLKAAADPCVKLLVTNAYP